MAELGHGGVQVEGRVDERGVATIRLAGELDLAGLDEARQGIGAVLAERTRRVVFDLEDLVFMDSSGIGVMLEVRNQVGAVEVRNASAIVRRVIEVSGLTELLGLAP